MKNDIDKISRDLFKEIGTESPSQEFKNNVMDKIYSLEKSKTKVYEPLLSRKVLIWISSIASFLIAILYFSKSSSESLQFPFEFNLEPSFPKIDIPNLTLSFSQYNVPSIWVYIVLAFPLFFVFERIAQKFMEKRL